MIRLVINADDLGLHPRIDEGIFLAHAKGLVTSASVLSTARHAQQAVERADAEGLPLGVHLCLTTHLPPAAPPRDVRWLAPGGRFRKGWAQLSASWLSRLVPKEEVELELRAQIERAIALGAKVDHLDTHQHLHLLPGLTDVVEGLARELGVPVRWPRERPSPRWLLHPRSAVKALLLGGLARVKPDGGVTRVRAHGVFESGRLDERRLVRFLESLGEGDHELCCHPGLAPGLVREDPDWRYDWEDELSALTGERARAVVERRGMQLVSYGELAAQAPPAGVTTR